MTKLPKRIRLVCVYCGRYTQRRRYGAVVCHNHADLPALDPFYAIPDQWKAAR